MDFYTCPVCNNQVNNNDREQHEMICNNAFREEEFMDMIPCEVCGRLVNYENYSEHLNRCYSFTGISDNTNFTDQLDSVINNLQNIINNSANVNLNENNENNEDNMDIDSDNDLPPLIDNDNDNDNEANNVMNIFMNIINSGIPGVTANNLIINPELDDYTQLTNLSETIGNVEIGIENPEDYFKKTVNIGFKCPICYNICENTMITSCNHEICVDCTKEWYSKNKKCVICMNEIKKL